MSAKSERPKNRRVKLVGGGYKWTRQSNTGGTGGIKAARRAMRQNIKGEENPTTRRAMKEQLRAMLAKKDGR